MDNRRKPAVVVSCILVVSLVVIALTVYPEPADGCFLLVTGLGCRAGVRAIEVALQVANRTVPANLDAVRNICNLILFGSIEYQGLQLLEMPIRNLLDAVPDLDNPQVLDGIPQLLEEVVQARQ